MAAVGSEAAASGRRPNHAGAEPMSASHYKWWVVVMLWFTCFFNYADRQAIFSVFPKLQEEFGFNDTHLGFIASAFMWVYAFGAPLAGYAGDRFRRKNLILGGFIFWSVVTVTTSWCARLWQFIAVRALEGLGETFYYPAAMSLAGDYHGRSTRSLAFGIHQTSVYAGTIAGSWAGAWFAERMGWRSGFYFFGAAGVLLAIVLARFLREPARGLMEDPTPLGNHSSLHPPPPFWPTLKAMLRSPTARVLLVVFVGANFVATIFMAWTPTFLVRKFGFKLAAAGLSGSVFIYLASAAGSPLAGWLADRWSRGRPGGRMMVQALGLGCGAGFIFLVGMTPNISTLLVAMTGFGLCKGFYDSNIFASLYDVVEPRARATAAGVMNMVGWTGGALGPIYLGWCAQHGRHAEEAANMSEAIARCGAIYLGGAALLIFAITALARKEIRPRPDVNFAR